MRRRHLLTPDQHAQIGVWVASGKTREAIIAMPAHLRRALTLASALMNVDADLTQDPALGADAPQAQSRASQGAARPGPGQFRPAFRYPGDPSRSTDRYCCR